MCFIIHKWITAPERRKVTDPPAGLYDPRDDAHRTRSEEYDVCAWCGKTRPTPQFVPDISP